MMTDGNNRPINTAELETINIYDYKDIKTIIEELNCGVKRAHIYKFIQKGKIKLENILVLHDSWNDDHTIKIRIEKRGWANGKKIFIHKDDIEKINKHYEETTFKVVPRCRYCERAWYACEKRPCLEKLKKDPEFREKWEADEREREQRERETDENNRAIDAKHKSLWNAAGKGIGNKGLATINKNRRQAEARELDRTRDSTKSGI